MAQEDEGLEGGETGRVTQYHYKQWVEGNLPRNVASFLQFIQSIHYQCPRRTCGTNMLVHCSAGVGRSGLFTAVDTLVQQLTMGHIIIDIQGIVGKLRKQRKLSVHYTEQYKFVHEAVEYAIRQQSGDDNWALGSRGSNTGPVPYYNDGMDFDDGLY